MPNLVKEFFQNILLSNSVTSVELVSAKIFQNSFEITEIITDSNDTQSYKVQLVMSTK